MVGLIVKNLDLPPPGGFRGFAPNKMHVNMETLER